MPMDVTRYGDGIEKRVDPWGRDYYWLTGGPPATVPDHETDLSALNKGKVTITPLEYDMTRRAALDEMQSWQFHLSAADAENPSGAAEISVPSMRIGHKKRRFNDE